MEMIFHYGDPFSYSKRENQNEIQPSSFLGGQINRCLTITPTGDVGMIGVSFHPYGAAALLSLPMGELAGETIDFVDIEQSKGTVRTDRFSARTPRSNPSDRGSSDETIFRQDTDGPPSGGGCLMSAEFERGNYSFRVGKKSFHKSTTSQSSF
jgi:hypothetical protein